MSKVLSVVAALLLVGCSTMLPQHGVFEALPDAEVARVQEQLGHDVTPEMIREQKVDYSAEVTVPCSEMLSICWGGMPVWQKLLGSVPLACTRFWIGTDRDEQNLVTGVWKTAIAYGCSLTPEWVWEHEREHLGGMGHL